MKETQDAVGTVPDPGAVGTVPDPGAVGTVPDPGAKPPKKLHAPTVVALIGLGGIIAVAILLVVTKWL